MSTAPGASELRQSTADAVSGLHVEKFGAGAVSLLYLHGEYGPRAERPFVEALGRSRAVAAGHHPGFGASAPDPATVTVLDVAFGYLSYLDTLPSGTTVDLVGEPLGGWIALHIATMYGHRIGKLVLLGSGVKLTPPADHDFADLFASSDDEVARLAFHDAAKAPFTGTGLSDEDILERAASREALVRYGWEPYLHDRSLKSRLSRVGMPTLLVAGGSDRLAREGYYSDFSGLIPGAKLHVMEKMGHYPAIEDPAAALGVVAGFLG